MLRKFIKGLGYALHGLISASATEKHLRFHYIATVCVVFFSFYWNISLLEWVVVILCIGLVVVSELINTALEKLVDLCHPHLAPEAGIIKDISAGAVLVASLVALIIGGIIFIPKLI
jgi:diacylglycerol kinase (ATP)